MFFGPVFYSSMNTSQMNQARGTKMRMPTPAAATSRMTPVGSTWKKKIKKLKGSYKENSLTLRLSPGVKATKKATCARRTPATNRCSTSDMAASTGIFDLGLVNTRETSSLVKLRRESGVTSPLGWVSKTGGGVRQRQMALEGSSLS